MRDGMAGVRVIERICNMFDESLAECPPLALASY
jgi:hypothetical protein